MANANPYYVQPAAAPLQGLQFIGERLEKRRDYQRALAKENEAKQLRTEAYSVLKSGTPEELEAFMGKSAEAQKAAESIMAS
ncbi:MAG: hypothetical protein GY746_10990, partial [Gammaproteobacteria bacterium]|nr:hypothetical protein [Gammaproteobacteria bacterium]